MSSKNGGEADIGVEKGLDPATTRLVGGRPTRERSGEIVNQILDSAMTEFAERGYHGSSIANIASRAGVTRVTVYKYFPKKDDILERVARKQALRLKQALQAAIDQPGDCADILMEVGRCFYRDGLSADSRAISRVLVMEAQRMPDLVRQWHELRWDALRPLTSYFERLALQGEALIDDPRRAAEQFLHLTTSTLDFLVDDEQTSEIDREVWTLAAVRMFLYGVRRRG